MHCQISRTSKYIDTESGLELTEDWGREGMRSYCLMVIEFMMTKFWKQE